MGFPSMRDGVSPSSIVLLTQPAPNPPHTPRLRSHTDTGPDVRPHHPSGDHGAPGVAHAHANPDRDRDAHAHADRDRDAHAHARWVGSARGQHACVVGPPRPLPLNTHSFLRPRYPPALSLPKDVGINANWNTYGAGGKYPSPPSPLKPQPSLPKQFRP